MLSLPILELLQDSDDPPLTRELVEELEAELGVTFPKEYAEFLLQFNGGDFRRPVMFYVPNCTRFPEGVTIDWFLGNPSDRGAGLDLPWFAHTLADRISADYLAIAHCNSQDYVLLKLVRPTSEFGGIWFWDSVGYWIPEDGPGRLHGKSCSEQDFFEVAFVPAGGEAFVLDADLGGRFVL
jgi:hypothetical protein